MSVYRVLPPGSGPLARAQYAEGADVIEMSDGRARVSEAAAGPTVHEFLARVVTDPRAHQEFEQDPAAALEEAGFGRLDSEQVRQMCAHALDCAPADVVESYRGSLRTGLAHGARPEAALAHPTTTHTTEIAFMDTPNLPTFGIAGDVDGALSAQGGALNVDATANGALNTATGTVDSAVAHGPVSDVTEQVHDTASSLPVAGPVAAQALPQDLPTVEQLPSAATGIAGHAPEQVHDIAGSLPVAGPVLDDAPTAVNSTVNHVTEPVHDVAGSLPVAGPVVNSLPAPEQATSHLAGLGGAAPAGLTAPVEGAVDNLPVVGDVAGQLPLHG